jgi:hypothetical protein
MTKGAGQWQKKPGNDKIAPEDDRGIWIAQFPLSPIVLLPGFCV